MRSDIRASSAIQTGLDRSTVTPFLRNVQIPHATF
jgi:hypothetical protein